jgi:hypothetical protein
MPAIATNKKTQDGLTIYDLDPRASELWAVAGPAGIDPATIDSDKLPDGFRWVDDAELADSDTDGEINEDSEAYNTGFEASKQGEGRDANPYPAGTWDAKNWDAGWDAE